ncbi:hypothetical protein [Okeania sp. SIO3B5]|nr:hypothetical protein [Okeania sp. SIO3B5]
MLNSDSLSYYTDATGFDMTSALSQEIYLWADDMPRLIWLIFC